MEFPKIRVIFKCGKDEQYDDGTIQHIAYPAKMFGPLLIISQLLDRYVTIGETRERKHDHQHE